MQGSFWDALWVVQGWARILLCALVWRASQPEGEETPSDLPFPTPRVSSSGRSGPLTSWDGNALLGVVLLLVVASPVAPAGWGTAGQ